MATEANLPERTILVVDDDPDVRDYAVAVLEDRGYRVLSAEDGVDALSVLARESSVDLLFTDVVMPRLNGFELAARARETDPMLKVLFTSGVVRSPAPDGETVLPKPYKYEELVRRIRALLASDR